MHAGTHAPTHALARARARTHRHSARTHPHAHPMLAHHCVNQQMLGGWILVLGVLFKGYVVFVVHAFYRQVAAGGACLAGASLSDLMPLC